VICVIPFLVFVGNPPRSNGVESGESEMR